jgi:hypothetical protein
MKSFIIAVVLCSATLVIVCEEVSSAAQGFDRGTCINAAKQKYGRGHKVIWAATRRCLTGGPGAI